MDAFLGCVRDVHSIEYVQLLHSMNVSKRIFSSKMNCITNLKELRWKWKSFVKYTFLRNQSLQIYTFIQFSLIVHYDTYYQKPIKANQ